MKNLYDSKRENEMIQNLKSLEVTPPDGLWDDIEATLDKQKRRRVIIITSWASAATIAILFTIGSFYILNSKQNLNSVQFAPKEVAKSILSDKENQAKEIIVTKSVNPELQTKSSNSSQNTIAIVALDSSESKISNGSRKIEFTPQKLTSVQLLTNKGVVVFSEEITLSSNFKTEPQGNSIALVETTKQGQKKKEWVISTSAFPVYSFHTAGVVNHSNKPQETGIMSWGGSVSIRRALSASLALEGGIMLNSWGQQVKNVYLVSSSKNDLGIASNQESANTFGVLTVSDSQYKLMDSNDFDNYSTNTVSLSRLGRVNASQLFRYIEVPIMLVKSFKVKSYCLNFKTGLSAGFIVSNRSKIIGNNLSLKGHTEGIDPFTASAIASISFAVPVMKNVNFVAEPTFRVGLNSLSASSGKSFPFSTYIKFGFEVPI